MNKITKLTFMTAAMFLLSAQAVYAENAPAETTEATTVAPVENNADNHEIEVVEEYQPKEKPFTGFTSRDGVTYYHVNNVPITSQWRKINEKWYYFNEEGIMQKSAIVDGYLLQDTGEMAQKDTVKIGENTFYADENGRIVYNSLVETVKEGEYLYFNAKGHLDPNPEAYGYLVGDNGIIRKNAWVEKDGKWYYSDHNGKTVRNTWQGAYYLKENGEMAKNEWIYDKNYSSWYYLAENGHYVSDKWEKINGLWYHFRRGGELDTNQWVGSYYVKGSGSMAVNEWVYDKNYSSWYYFDGNGFYITDKWEKINGKWYHFRRGGELDTNKWIGSYYVTADGSMRE